MKKIVLFLSLLLTMFAFSSRAQVTVFSEGFEDGVLPAGWTNIDSDGDGNTWVHNSTTYVDGHTGEGAYVSFSKLNGAALTPDNWLVTPPITLTGASTLHFWRMSGFSQPAEHYGIFVSTTSATDLTSFTLVYDETLPSYHWDEKTVDLSAYTGSTVYIAFRHYNCTNKMALILDDVSVTSMATSAIITAVPTALQFLNVPAGAPSAAQTVSVSGYNLAGAITAMVNAPFEVSLNNINFSNSVTMASTDSVLYVRYFPAYANVDTAILTLTDGSVTTEVTLSGNGIECNMSLPYTQNFNSVPQNCLPECWTKINPFDGYPKAVEDYGTGNGDKVLMFKCNYNTYEPIYAVMPLMPLSLSDLQISFYTFREGSYSGTLSVGYVTSPGDSSTFVPVWSINAAQIGDNNPHPYLVSFENVGTDPNNQYFITFKYETSSNWYWFVDDITVEEIPSCGTPSGLTVDLVTSTSATVNWNGGTDFYNLYYRASYDTSWTEIANIAADSAGFVIDNLASATDYLWYVASICEDGSTVNSLGTGSFTTACGAYIAPFAQNFDGSTTLPICWGRFTGLASNIFAGGSLTEATSGWVFNNTQVFGANHAKLNIWGTNVNNWLVTPPIDLSALTNPVLTFDLALTAYNNASPIGDTTAQQDDKFMVIVSTDFGATWSAANATVWSNDGNGDHVFNHISAAGEEATISLANYANQTVLIAFYGESTVTGNGDNDLHVDNVMVYNATSCVKPSNLSVSAVTANSVTLAWGENGSATNWNIEYGPSGYTQGSTSGTLVDANANPFTIGNLSAMAYDFYVQADCGDEQSLWIGPVTATPGTYNMGVTGSDTLTTCDLIVLDNGGANGNYSSNCNYTLVLYPETAGSSIAVSGTYNTESGWDYLYIYDGAGTGGTQLGQFSGAGTIPAMVASNGPLTLKFTSDGGVNMSGFQLNVTCASCTPPGFLTTSNLTATSTDLTWVGMSTTYMVEYKADSDTVWTSETTLDTFLTLNGLTPLTSYQVNVYGDCGGDYSPAASITFITPMVATAIPYNTDFSDGSDQNWLLNNGSCANGWMIGAVSDSDNALFISSNNNTPGYNTSVFSVVTAEKIFTIGEATEVIINFDVKVGGEDEFDFMKVFFAPSDTNYPAINTNVAYASATFSQYAVDFTNYLPYTGTDNPYAINLTNDSTLHITTVMPNPVANPSTTSTAKLVFLWRNDTSNGDQPGAVIDNVSVEAVACPAPVDLTITSITTTDAVLEWTPTGTEESWTLEFKEASDNDWTTVTVNTAPSYSFDNLQSGTTYQVRIQANCDAGEQSIWTNFTFSTPCDAVSTFPYTEGFENGGNMPDCWTQEYVIGAVNWTFRAGASSSSGIHEAHTGDYNAFFYQNNNNGYTTRLVSPILDLTNLTDPYITYWYAKQAWGNDQDYLYVYYRTAPDEQWLPLTQYSSSVVVWTMDSLALPNPSATYQIAFVGNANYGHGIVLDDITVDGVFTPEPEPCDAPTGLHAVEVGNDFIILEWDNDPNVNTWQVSYYGTGGSLGPESGEYFTETNIDTFHYEFIVMDMQHHGVALTTSIYYHFTVRALCENNTWSAWSDTITVATPYVGIEDRLEKAVTLYPNPAKEYVDIRVDGEVNVTDMEIFDVYGKMIWTNNHSSIPTRINVSGLADGIYFVRVTTDEGTVTKRFVKK